MIVLASGAVTFHSDEAVVGLMARHINRGAIPIFFYGQPYMGSLDALIVAMSFHLFGETVNAIRIPQIALYLGFLTTSMLLAYRLAGQRTMILSGLLLAFGSAVLTLYSTISLGGYGELLLLGNIALLVGWEIGRGRGNHQRWALLGTVIGLGWWTHGLILTYALAVGGWLLFKRQLALRDLVIAAICFFVFSSPWWLYQFSNDWASIRFLLSGFSGDTVTVVSIPDKLIGLLLIGLPGIVGARLAAASTLWTPPGWLVVVLWIALLVLALRLTSKEDGKKFLWLMVAAFTLIFVFSSFGVDATGRYLLPLFLPLTLLLTMTLRGKVGTVVITALLIFQTVGVIKAIRTQPPGLTPQFDPETDLPNSDDARLIDFLQTHNLYRGYSTYWISYRIAFLSRESIDLVPNLPYDSKLKRVGTDRYADYRSHLQRLLMAVGVPSDTALVTANNPMLDQALTSALGQSGQWKVEQIGVYRVYYDLPPDFTIPTFSPEGR
ncbi:MAG: glycosyltransferase family 39 protein [Anaerolineae bacterium]